MERPFRALAGSGVLLVLASACAAPAARSPRPIRAAAPAARAAVVAPAVAPAPPGDLAAGLTRALDASPAIRAALARAASQLERAPQAAAWPDPILRARLFAEEVQTRVGPQEWALGLSQRFPWPGERGRREDVERARAAALFRRADDVALGVLERATLAWCDLAWFERAGAIVGASRDRLVEFEEVLRNQFASGEVPYAHLLRVQVELGRIEDRLRELDDAGRPAAARWNAALHLPVDASTPHDLALPARGPLRSEAELARRLVTDNPALAARRDELRAADASREVARLEGRPALTVGVEWIATGDALAPGVAGSGEDPLVASVSLPLTFLRRDRWDAREREAEAARRAVSETLALDEDTLAARLAELHFEARDAERRVSLFADTLVPRATSALEANETAFRGGDVDFLDLIDAERALLDLELSLAAARVDRARAIARLERLVGSPVTTSTTGAER